MLEKIRIKKKNQQIKNNIIKKAIDENIDYLWFIKDAIFTNNKMLKNLILQNKIVGMYYLIIIMTYIEVLQKVVGMYLIFLIIY